MHVLGNLEMACISEMADAAGIDPKVLLQQLVNADSQECTDA